MVWLKVSFFAAALKLNLSATLVVRFDIREGLQRGIINKLRVFHNLDERRGCLYGALTTKLCRSEKKLKLLL